MADHLVSSSHRPLLALCFSFWDSGRRSAGSLQKPQAVGQHPHRGTGLALFRDEAVDFDPSLDQNKVSLFNPGRAFGQPAESSHRKEVGFLAVATDGHGEVSVGSLALRLFHSGRAGGVSHLEQFLVVHNDIHLLSV